METQLAELQQQILTPPPPPNPHPLSSHHQHHQPHPPHHQPLPKILHPAEAEQTRSLLSPSSFSISASQPVPAPSSLSRSPPSSCAPPKSSICLDHHFSSITWPQPPSDSLNRLPRPFFRDDQPLLGDVTSTDQPLSSGLQLALVDFIEPRPPACLSPQRFQPLDAFERTLSSLDAGNHFRELSLNPQAISTTHTTSDSPLPPSSSPANLPAPSSSLPNNYQGHYPSCKIAPTSTDHTPSGKEFPRGSELASQESEPSFFTTIATAIPSKPLLTTVTASDFLTLSGRELQSLTSERSPREALKSDLLPPVGDIGDLPRPDARQPHGGLSHQDQRSPSLLPHSPNQLDLSSNFSFQNSKTFSFSGEEVLSQQSPQLKLSSFPNSFSELGKLTSSPSSQACEVASGCPSPSLARCSSLQEVSKKSKKKAPLSSSGRCRLLLPGSLSSATSEIEHGFTTEEDVDRGPMIPGQTIHSMAGAPMPAVYGLVHQSQTPEGLSSSAQPETSTSSALPSLSGPAPLSDENLQRQCLAPKERVRRSIKMRDTERWALQTASTSQQASPTGRSSVEDVHVSEVEVHSNISCTAPASPAELGSLNNPICEASPVTSHHPSESRQPLTVLPVPHARPVPLVESGVGSMIASEVASVNDWLSENTTNVGVNQSNRNHPVLSLSPTDVQIVGLTPTSPFSPGPSMFIQPGTLIGDVRAEGAATGAFNAIVIETVSSPSNPHPREPSTPKIEELPVTPTERSPPDLSDPLIKARLSLQEALSTTPQARNSSPGSGHSISPSPARPATKVILPVSQALSDHSSDDESGLSAIKEDRTAELAAEHSWKIRNENLVPTINQNLQPFKPGPSPDAASVGSTTRVPSPLSCSSQPNHAGLAPTQNPQPPAVMSSPQSPVESSNLGPSQNPTSQGPTQSQTPLRQSPKSAGLVSQDPSLASIHQFNVLSESSSQSELDGADNEPDQSNHAICPLSAPPASPPSGEESHNISTNESISNRRQALPLSIRAGPLHKPNPPLSIPANARRPLPSDLLSRLEMEEWREQTGIDDRHGLFIRGSGPSSEGESRVIGLGGEERRGMKDRWGNSWGLESHVLSPLSEHTERSLTTAPSCLSLSTRQSVHSLRSIDSPSSNSLAQRLNEAEVNSARMAKLGSVGLSNSGKVNMVNSASSPKSNPGSPTKANEGQLQHVSQDLKEPHMLLEEKLRRKEARKIKREKREKRRLEELKRCESLAEKQERRRREKKKKEEFLERKQKLLNKLQVDPENPTLIRDLGILYFSCNAGVAGLKLAIKHLETSLQVCDSDPVAWSCLGKAWAQMHDMPEDELAKLGDRNETDKNQQAHNATIGLRKAILNSRSSTQALTFKVEWARYLEKLGRWRDSLGVIGEVIGNEGKMDPRSWAALGFIGLRIVFGWAPLKALDADDLQQGFLEAQTPEKIADESRVEELSDVDRLKLLIQVGNAFERALELLMGEIDLSPERAAQRQETQRYRDHYSYQLKRVKEAEAEMRERQSYVSETVGSNDECSQIDGSDAPRFDDSRKRIEPACRSPIADEPSDKQKVEQPTTLPQSFNSKVSVGNSPAATSPGKRRADGNNQEDMSRSFSEDGSLRQVADPDPTCYGSREISDSAVGKSGRREVPEMKVAGSLNLQDSKAEELRSYAQSPAPESFQPLSLSQVRPGDDDSALNQSRKMSVNNVQPHLFNPDFGSESECVLQYDDVDTTNDYTDERMVEVPQAPGGLNQKFIHQERLLDDSRREHSLPSDSPAIHRTPSVLDLSKSHREMDHLETNTMPGYFSSNETHQPPCSMDTPADSVSEQDIEVAHTDPGEYFTPVTAGSMPPSASAVDKITDDSQPLPVLVTRPSSDSRVRRRPSWVASSHAVQDNCSSNQHICCSRSSSQLQAGADIRSDRRPPAQPHPQAQAQPTIDHGESCLGAHDRRRDGGTTSSRPVSRESVLVQGAESRPGHSMVPGQYDHYRGKIKAFLELDNKFYDQTFSLRKRLVEIEEEHGRRRREIIEELGLREVIQNEVLARETSGSDSRLKSEAGFLPHSYCYPHSAYPNNNLTIDPPSGAHREIHSGFESRQKTPGSRGGVSDHQPRRVLENDGFEGREPHYNREDVNSSVTLQGSPPGRSGEVGQANIALQGIAAILRLASTTSAGGTSTSTF